MIGESQAQHRPVRFRCRSGRHDFVFTHQPLGEWPVLRSRERLGWITINDFSIMACRSRLGGWLVQAVRRIHLIGPAWHCLVQSPWRGRVEVLFCERRTICFAARIASAVCRRAYGYLPSAALSGNGLVSPWRTEAAP